MIGSGQRSRGAAAAAALKRLSEGREQKRDLTGNEERLPIGTEGQVFAASRSLFLPTIRHVKRRITSVERGRVEHWKTVSVVHSLQSLFMEQRVVCLLGGWAAGADCLFANIAVARIAFFFADSARYLYTPSVSPSFLFIFPSSRLLHPLFSLLFSSILEWTTNDATDERRDGPRRPRGPRCTCRKGKHLSGWGSPPPALSPLLPDPPRDLRGLIMFGSFEAR